MCDVCFDVLTHGATWSALKPCRYMIGSQAVLVVLIGTLNLWQYVIGSHIQGRYVIHGAFWALHWPTYCWHIDWCSQTIHCLTRRECTLSHQEGVHSAMICLGHLPFLIIFIFSKYLGMTYDIKDAGCFRLRSAIDSILVASELHLSSHSYLWSPTSAIIIT